MLHIYWISLHNKAEKIPEDLAGRVMHMTMYKTLPVDVAPGQLTAGFDNNLQR